jgi:hypothetical protein
MAVFLQVLAEHVDNKAAALLRAVRDPDKQILVEPSAFKALPGSPFSYWISPSVLEVFAANSPLERPGRAARAGGQTSDDDRYVRAFWEVRSTSKRYSWRTYVKGGRATPFYVDYHLVARWDPARQTFYGFIGRPGRANERPSNYDLYFQPGITWPLRASRFAPQLMPSGAIFTVRGYAILAAKSELLPLASLGSSRVFDALAKTMLGRFEYPEFVVGVVQKLPVPELTAVEQDALTDLALRSWSIRRRLDEGSEISHAFALPDALRSDPVDREKAEQELEYIQSEIDRTALNIYNISEDDISGLNVTPDPFNELSENIHEGDQEEESDLDDLAVLSWAIGVCFGRFDIRMATGERAFPAEPDPFDPLPAKSPGMLAEIDPPFMPTTGVFVDDPGHPDDIALRVTAVYARMDATPPGPAELRLSLAKDFFPLHIRMYSKSRRRAPIYWQLATPQASYSVWLHIHAFTKDTLFRVQNEYLAPKLRDERQQLDRLRGDGGAAPTTAQSRAIEIQLRVAPLWDPDLDDGVILNFAPLWRLVPQNRAWQKECRMAWEALVNGDYDWAHIAIRLWPERVVPKCAKDRSLAIAHDLEDVLWVEGADGKWAARKPLTRSMDELIAERTSPAVKAALTSLLEAPEPVTASRRRGRALA